MKKNKIVKIFFIFFIIFAIFLIYLKFFKTENKIIKKEQIDEMYGLVKSCLDLTAKKLGVR